MLLISFILFVPAIMSYILLRIFQNKFEAEKARKDLFEYIQKNGNTIESQDILTFFGNRKIKIFLLRKDFNNYTQIELATNKTIPVFNKQYDRLASKLAHNNVLIKYSLDSYTLYYYSKGNDFKDILKIVFY